VSSRQDALYKRAVEARLKYHGEWIKHVRDDQTDWVFLQFVDRHEDANLRSSEIEIMDVRPYLHGHASAFSVLPKKVKNYNRHTQISGSVFIIRDKKYRQQDKVNVNHRNGIKIDLSLENDQVDQSFFSEQERVEHDQSL
jgi:hypothetical protein